MKKFFSLVLALVMALSLTTVAWGDAMPADDADGATDNVINLTADFALDTAFTVTSGNVTIQAATPVKITTALTDAIQVSNGATLTLGANVTIESTNGAVLWANGGNIVINGTVITSSGTQTVAYVNNGGSLTVNSGSITATGAAKVICVDGATASATVNGDTVAATHNANIETVSVLGGTFTVDGGAVSSAASSTIAIGTTGGTVKINAGTVSTNAAGMFAAAFGYSGAINVTGGTIKNTNSANTSVALAAAGAAVTVSSGNVQSVAVTGTGGTVSITGGTFDSAVPAEYCATGYVPVVKDGTFTVGTAPAASGTTGNNSFSSSTTSGVTTSVSAAEKYAIYEAASTTKVTPWTVKAYTTMATKTVTSNGVTTTSYIPAYYGVDVDDDGVVDIKLYEADANSGMFRIFKGDQFVTYVNPLGNALTTGGYVDGDYISDSAAYIAKDKGCGTYGEDVYKINNAKAYAVDPMGRFVAVINGKVAVYDGARLSVPHTFTDEVTYKSTTDLTVVAIECDVCEKVFQVVKTTKLPATYKGATANLTFGGNNYYILLETAVTSGTGTVGGTSTDKVTSAETFDAGIAMYVGMSIMAATGSAVVIGKKRG